MTYLLVLGVFILSYLVGSGSSRLLRVTNPTLFEKCVIGLCTMILISSLVFLIGVPKPSRYFLIFGAYLIVILVGKLEIKISVKIFKNIGKTLVSLLAFTMLYSFAYSGDINGNSIRQRVGPDLLGWIASAQYIEQNDSLDLLQNWIGEEFPNSDQRDPFSKEYFGTRDSIYFTANYTKQIQAEFLIGGQRFGLPSYLGLNFLPFFGVYQWQAPYLALSALFHFLLMCWVLEVSRMRRLNKGAFPKMLIGGVGLLSTYTLLFPVFEGGFGQHLSFIIFCLALNRFHFSNWKLWILILSTTLMSYKDLIFFALPFLASMLFLHSKEGFIFSWLMRNKIKSLFVISTFLCGAYFIGFFTRLSSLSFGGWEEGNLPSIIDIFGLSGVYTWQKQGEFSLGYSVFSIGITLILTSLVLIRERTPQNLRIAILIILFAWISYSLLAIVYKNNYLLWKSLPYFSIYVFLVIVLKAKFPNRILSNYLISIQIIFALVFFHFWNRNSTQIEIFTSNQENSKIVARYVDNYALDFREQKFINTWALMGNMEWGISGRQIAQKITEKSKREKLYIIPKSICERTEQKDQILHMFADVCIVKLSDNSSNRMSKE